MDLTYIASALEPESWPKLLDPSGQPLPEIALAGRSNVGKSTFLNLLAGKRTLAKISSIPGKTQRIQFFHAENTLAVVDLPGYGYAKAPAALQAEWSAAIHTYLTQRASLKRLILLLDIRRDPSSDDLQLLEWATKHPSLDLLLVLTKTDLLSKRECEKHYVKLLEVLSPYNLTETPLSVPAPRQVVWNRVVKKIYAAH